MSPDEFLTVPGADTILVDAPDETRYAEATLTLAVGPSRSVCGRLMTFTATVAALSPESGTPTGTVTFTADSSPTNYVTLQEGVATFTTDLDAGVHTVTAGYHGDAHFTSAPLASLTTRTWRTGFPEPTPCPLPDPQSATDDAPADPATGVTSPTERQPQLSNAGAAVPKATPGSGTHSARWAAHRWRRPAPA